MKKKIELVSHRGETSVFIDVEITDQGDLLFSGQDLGKAPLETFGDSDYEYWLQVKAEDIDKLLLVLIEKLYSGDLRLISQLMELMKAAGIPYEFFTYS